MNTSALLAELAAAQEAARTDPLTGLGNVRALDEILGRCFREQTLFSIVLFDLASMKRANAVLGYEAVDAMLTRIGNTLRKNRGDGFAVRKGGDEFLIVLPGQGIRTARRVRDRVEKAVGVTRLRDGTRVFIAGGVAHWGGRAAFATLVLAAQRELESRKVARR